MYDYFNRKYEKPLNSAKRMLCSYPKCLEEALEFKYLDYFKNHIESVYGVKLRA